jgi:hypothetical protein
VADGVIVRDAEAVTLEVAVSVLDAVVVLVALWLAVSLAVCKEGQRGREGDSFIRMGTKSERARDPHRPSATHTQPCSVCCQPR